MYTHVSDGDWGVVPRHNDLIGSQHARLLDELIDGADGVNRKEVDVNLTNLLDALMNLQGNNDIDMGQEKGTRDWAMNTD